MFNAMYVGCHIWKIVCLQLLGEERFQDIEKIKTIGSTYMAVSGLSPEKQVWKHTETYTLMHLMSYKPIVFVVQINKNISICVLP